jgi:hypothetical protein
MNMKTRIETWKGAEHQHFSGWDFSHLQDQAIHNVKQENDRTLTIRPL